MSLTRSGFQSFVNNQPPPAVVGDFASMNPRAVALAGPGALRAVAVAADAAGALIVGNFGWGKPADGIAYGSEQADSVLGFVANESQTVITDFLGKSRLAVQGGFPVTLYTHGDFWAFVAGGAVAPGDTIYAVAATGAPTVDPAASANPDTGYVAASALPVNGVSTSSAAIAADTGVLTVGAMSSGVVQVGDNITGTGVPPNLFVKSILTGDGSGAGTYQLNYQGPAVTTFVATFSRGGLVKISRTF